MEDLRASGDQSGDGLGGSILRSFLVNSEANSGPILDPYLRNLMKPLELPLFGRR